MGSGWREMLRSFANLFTWNKRKRKKSGGAAKRDRAREKRDKRRDKQPEDYSNGSSKASDVEEDASSHVPSSCDCDDDDTYGRGTTHSFLHDESQTASDAPDDDREKDEALQAFTGSRPAAKTLPHDSSPPYLAVEECLRRYSTLHPKYLRHLREPQVESSSLLLAKSPPADPLPGQEPPPKVSFQQRTLPEGGRRRCRSPFRKASFQVKYTKVYGEAENAYRNDSTPRGLVFVCNFSEFQDDKYSPRVGSEKDYENILNLFQQMGYSCHNRKGRYCLTGFITKQTFLDSLKKFSNDAKHKILCSCVVILMSHGSGPKTFITSDNQKVDLLDVYKIFDNVNCRLLEGKPKIFILQFCRSQEDVHSQTTIPQEILINAETLEKIIREQIVQVLKENHDLSLLSTSAAQGIAANRPLLQQVDAAPPTSPPSPHLVTTQGAEQAGASSHSHGNTYQVDTRNLPAQPQLGLHRYSDMYSIFSTSPGEISHRDPHKGSLLIQAICHVFAENAYNDEIETLVKKVSTYMSKTLQKDDPITVPRQTCERTNNGLDKYFYFNPHEMHQCRHVTI